MPADPRRAVLLRRIEAVDGPAKVTVALDVRAGYGRERDDGPGPARRTAGPGRSGGDPVPLVGRGRARRADGGLGMTISLAPGSQHDSRSGNL